MSNFVTNIDALLDSKIAASCVKDLFREIQKTGYATPEWYFSRLSDGDLSLLLATTNEMSKSDEAHQADPSVVLLTVGFLIGEGLEVSDAIVIEATNQVVLMITVEALSRKGVLKPYRENWCLFGDGSKIWSEPVHD